MGARSVIADRDGARFPATEPREVGGIVGPGGLVHIISGGRIVAFGSWVAVGLCLALAGCTGSGPSPEESPTVASPSASSPRLPDFDGDGAADLVAGIGEAQGRVTVRYATGRTQDVRRADLDGAASATFARAILARDLDGDGFTDLVVSDPGSEAEAAVFLVPGSPTGLDLASAHSLAAPAGLASFGTALAVVDSPATLLAVGAPGQGAGSYGPPAAPWRPGGSTMPGSRSVTRWW